MKEYTLESYVENGKMSQAWYDLVCESIESQINIIIGGQNETGKTTLLNAIMKKIGEMCPDRPLYLVGQINKLKCYSNNFVRYVIAEEEMENTIINAYRTNNAIIIDDLRTYNAVSRITKYWYLFDLWSVVTVKTLENDKTDFPVLNRLNSWLAASNTPDKHNWEESSMLLISLSSNEKGKIEQMELREKIKKRKAL